MSADVQSTSPNTATSPANVGKCILFVLFEGLPATVIDTQVLLHARAAQAAFGIHFEVWSFCGLQSLYERSLSRQSEAERLADCPVRVFRAVRAGVPGSKLVNRAIFRRLLLPRASDFDLVHARNDYVAATVGPVVRRLGLPMIWDCRGDPVAEFDARPQYASLPRWLKAMRLRVLLRERELAARDCGAALFVSHPLTSLCAPLLGEKPYQIIPCGAQKEMFYFDPVLRQRVRSELGYNDADRVFIYSGGLAHYQCIPQVLSLFREVRASDARARLLLVTPDIERMRAMCESMAPDDIQLRSGRIGDINGFLNAADFGFILRAHNAINRVAFPTKFAEHCLTGLPVILDDAIPDCASLADRWGNRLAPEPAAILQRMDTDIDRVRVMQLAQAEVTWAATAARYAQIYGVS